MPPIRFGIKNTVLKALVPRSPLVISSATAKAMTLTVITETKVNLTVSHREFRKVSSWNFTVFPSQTYKDDLGAALLKYAQGSESWDQVKKLAVDEWSSEFGG